ncbi:WXG100 family type VII secretion target [Saccharomonospora glauca]|jgi:hypothetical protein|uniref:Uncharacterized protein n=1 Tax=Saccharomonospora glauca K62 TaxID=928724 RepID=I1CXH7_9PSEU|nr:hypothetical protein [Saccharomonospora glauca]EIE97401.1 hypothetical protein SacglDRAFT_00450 [Saccharomonospora glauca K62]
MTEVNDIAGSIELSSDNKETVLDMALGLGAQTPVVKHVIKGYDTVTNIWQGLPEDPDAADIMMHVGNVAADAASFTAECALEAGAAVADPVNWLVENGLGMVLHLVSPLQDALHMVSGDGPALSAASDDFSAIGEGLVEYSNEFVRVADETLADWQGEASNAARNALADFAKGIEGVATSAGGVAQILKISSMIMTVVEEVIKAIITEFVSWLIWIWIPALASSWVTFGTSVATAMSASVAKAASAFSRVTSKMGKLGKLLDKIIEFFKKFVSKLAKLGERLGAKQTNYTELKDEMIKKVGELGRRGALKEAATESLKAGGSAALSSIAGIESPSDLKSSPLEVGKTVLDASRTIRDNISDATDAVDKGDIGSGASAQETRDLLDM